MHTLVDELGFKAVNDLLRRAGAERIWPDYKFHDITQTTEDRVRIMAQAGANMITTHASGGIKMMQSALRGAGDTCQVYAVTVLTTITDEEVAEVWGAPRDVVTKRLALLAARAGVHGIVCSPREVGMLAQMPELNNQRLITPGVRSIGVSANDQQCVETPTYALEEGADILVVGRQVTKDADPIEALDKLEAEIEDVRSNHYRGDVAERSALGLRIDSVSK